MSIYEQCCSAVVVSYHTGPVLFACIRSLLRQDELLELIIVDNGNPPDVASRLQQWMLSEPRLKVISGHGNIGFGKGCNLGAARAQGEYILLLNPDCLMPPDGINGLLLGLNEIDGAMLAGPFLQHPDGKEQRGGRRRLLTPQTALAEAFYLHKLPWFKRVNDRSLPLPEHVHEVPAISGACMCLRKDDYSRLGGFDEAFFLHVEDLDLCIRVHKLGGRIICAPQVKVTHMLSSSGETTSRFIEWQKAKGFVYYFRKHFKGHCPFGVLTLASFGIWARYVLRVALRRRKKPERSLAEKRLLVLASGLAELPESSVLHGKIIFVTGATSQVGLCVIRRLLAAGASVLALSRGDEVPFYHQQLRWIKGDLTDRNFNMQGYLADMVVHCAALWHLPPVLKLLADAEVKRLVAFSSTSVFGKVLSRNSYERDTAKRLARAEQDIAAQCSEMHISWTIFRPTLIYGVGLDNNISRLTRLIRKYGRVPVYPPAFGKRQPVHADDLALAVLQVLEKPITYGKSYNLSGGEIITYRDMVERLFLALHKPPRIKESTLLPFLLDVAGKLFRRGAVNGEMARRMNDDLVFFHEEATHDFAYSPRAYLSGGMHDIEGY